MKRDFNKWLATLGDTAPVKSLSELRKWNEAHQKAGAMKYAQANLDISDEMDVERDRDRYEADRAKDVLQGATRGIDAAMKAMEADGATIEGPAREVPGLVKVGFVVGQSVRIVDGPFMDFVGQVDDINLEKGKVKVLVSFFGRETPVELDFLQVERA